ncbi:MAG: hypothetical protein Q8M54_02535 [Desulfobaccales bacterium]|nr:hypothetical protein [Desulfobaccales bacterium]
MDLYLAEYDYQVADFTAPGEVNKGQWVALGPSAMHYLSRRGISYRIPEDFISREEIEEACVAQFEVLTRICRELDNILLKDDPFLKAWGIKPFFSHLWQLGQLLDLLLSRTLILKKICEHYPGATVHTHQGDPQNWSLFGLGFSFEENLWGRLLNLPGWEVTVLTRPERRNKKKPQEELKPTKNGFLPIRLKPFLSSLLRATPWGLSLGQSIHKGWWRNIWNILKPGKFGKRCGVIVGNGLYEWAGILPELMARGHPVYFLYTVDLKKGTCGSEVLGKSRPETLNSLWDKFRQALPHLPIDFTSIIKDRFEFIVEKVPVLAQGLVRNLEGFYSGKKIKALLISAVPDFSSYVMKQYCRKKNVRVLSWQHGAEWYDKRMSQRNDLTHLVGCDLMLVYGDAVKNGYKSSPLPEAEKCQLVSVGMPSLKPLRDISPVNPEGKIRILWPYGGYYKNSWYCGFSPPQSDRVYYQEQMIILQNIMELISKNKKISVTVKLYNSSAYNPPWVEELTNHEMVRIILNRPNFTELLPQHDLVIIDSPTTTLLQAVATKLPVFALMSVIRWPQEAITLLEKRAYCAERAEDLMKGLKQFIEKGTYPGEVTNDEFLKQYGTHDGNGHQVALSLMEKILHDQPSL